MEQYNTTQFAEKTFKHEQQVLKTRNMTFINIKYETRLLMKNTK